MGAALPPPIFSSFAENCGPPRGRNIDAMDVLIMNLETTADRESAGRNARHFIKYFGSCVVLAELAMRQTLKSKLLNIAHFGSLNSG